MMTQMRRSVCWGILLLTIVGCAKAPQGDPDALPHVQCKILLKGNEVENAVVRFHGDDASQQITGYYDADTSLYRFVTKAGETSKAGVPVGNYKVSIAAQPNAQSEIPDKYADPANSGLTTEIKKGNNTLVPFEI